MSALEMLMNGGFSTPAEPEQPIIMTESDVSALITLAIKDGVLEDASASIMNDSQSVLMEGVLPEEMPVIEKSIIKLDKSAKKQQAYKLAILQEAREDDNKDLKKLETLWKMEKYLFRKLERRYATRAKRRMAQAAKKTTPKTKHFAKAKNVLTRSQRETKAALHGKPKMEKGLKTEYNTIAKKLSHKLA